MEELDFYYAFTDNWTQFYCAECYCKNSAIHTGTLLEYVENGAISTIDENTVQYEQWPGEIIPLEGVYCSECGAELYAPLETEGE